ncbi:formate dehydrogenase subunit gamma [Streptomyces spiralis]|uniref:Formate dehydrogenase subunit gamma n=1 Tax=Streptomyces spiralis TaxID=66376 RepID=A0A919AAN4_9ACTN|nr:cytochrome b/b6 domain-containing protein [Streptomyces spiralis]GHE95790.1 formate dehydrogenase subunit gamma [Streptomyces spiralis]
MSLRAETPAPPGTHIRRFTRAERWVHRTTATLMGVCVVTAAWLYIPQLAVLVGRRELVVRLHEWAGLALPVPVLLGLASRAFRADLRFLNRFGPHDKVWLRAALRRDRRPSERPAGKFNAGQKIYAAWIAGATLVMLGTGLLMWFTHLTPLQWRTSATFVHDWLALTIGIVLGGHIGMALGDPEARRGLRTGLVRREWADSEHPLWKG